MSNFVKLVCHEDKCFTKFKFDLMNEYMLIFRHEDGSKVASPEQLQKWMEQTMEWLDGIASQNKLVDQGNGLLFDDSRVVRHDKVVVNGPFGDVKETIGGFVIVRASSSGEAAELAKDCPILQGEGNTVEVRRMAQ